MTCDTLREQMIDYVVAGEPADDQYAAMRARCHRSDQCQQDLDHLRQVELALRALPLEEVSASLQLRLLAIGNRPRQPIDLYPLPWAIWLPALTVLIAIGLVLLLAPIPLSIALQPATAPWEWTPAALSLDQDALQAVWVGVSVALAGIGVTMALSETEMPDRRDMDGLRSRATHAIERIWRLAGLSR